MKFSLYGIYHGSAYLGDFVYKENNQLVAEDKKGFRAEVYNIKRKLFKARYPEYIFKES